jgi:hypothetical protein
MGWIKPTAITPARAWSTTPLPAPRSRSSVTRTSLSLPSRAPIRPAAPPAGLLATGPLAGTCWASALITSRAWTWPVPAIARGLLGMMLITVIGLLMAAAFARRYRLARRMGIAGSAAVTALDAVMLVPFHSPPGL